MAPRISQRSITLIYCMLQQPYGWISLQRVTFKQCSLIIYYFRPRCSVCSAYIRVILDVSLLLVVAAISIYISEIFCSEQFMDLRPRGTCV